MKKQSMKEVGEATRARVRKEMAVPRMAASAREGERNLAAERAMPAKRAKPKLPIKPTPRLRRAR
jgi:hypothetical protein